MNEKNEMKTEFPEVMKSEQEWPEEEELFSLDYENLSEIVQDYFYLHQNALEEKNHPLINPDEICDFYPFEDPYSYEEECRFLDYLSKERIASWECDQLDIIENDIINEKITLDEVKFWIECAKQNGCKNTETFFENYYPPGKILNTFSELDYVIRFYNKKMEAAVDKISDLSNMEKIKNFMNGGKIQREIETAIDCAKDMITDKLNQWHNLAGMSYPQLKMGNRIIEFPPVDSYTNCERLSTTRVKNIMEAKTISELPVSTTNIKMQSKQNCQQDKVTKLICKEANRNMELELI